MKIVIASRKSDLARIQAYEVADAIKAKFPELRIEHHFRESLGDVNLRDPLWKMPEKGVFTADLTEGLIQRKWDLVVHSWKDLPTEENLHTEVVATLPRADTRDLLLAPKDRFASGKTHLRVLSSSPRREYNLTPFLQRHWPGGASSVQFESVRGNVLTRIQKLFDGDADALIVAKAAIDRFLNPPRSEFSEAKDRLLAFLSRAHWMILPIATNPTAAAQGALAIEIKRDNSALRSLLSEIQDQKSFAMVQAERKILSGTGGGCHQKLGISIQAHGQGQIETVVGESHSIRRFLRTAPDHSPSGPRQGFSSSEVDWFDRKKVKNLPPPDADGLYVSHPEALPEDWPLAYLENKFIWTAGLSTWSTLAKKGLWVNGCDESLGEADPQVNHLANRALDWVRLSHDRAQGGLPLLATYSLQDLPIDAEVLKDRTHFFWKSSESFLRAVHLAPHIIARHHSAGLGKTAGRIREHFPDLKIELFLDEREWRRHFGFN